jgi:hypothetical protein
MFALGPLVNLEGLFIEALLVEGLIGIECGRICVFTNGWVLLIGSRVGREGVSGGMGSALLVGGREEGPSTVLEHQSLEFRSIMTPIEPAD